MTRTIIVNADDASQEGRERDEWLAREREQAKAVAALKQLNRDDDPVIPVK